MIKSIRFLLWLTGVLSAGYANAQPVFNWANENGGAGSDDNWSLAVDAAGNVYRTGHFSDTVDFDPGPGVQNLIATIVNDIFVSKTDSSGLLLWVKQFESIDSNQYDSNLGASVAVDVNGNVYVTGSFMSRMDFDPGPGTYLLQSIGGPDVYICKLDASGNFQWAQRYGGDYFSYDDGGASVITDASGNVYSTGSFNDSASFGSFKLGQWLNGLSIYVMKQSPSGTVLWAREIGNSWGSSFGSAVAIDPQGNLVSMASLNGNSVITKFDPDGDISWQNTINNLGQTVRFGRKGTENMTVDNVGNIFTISSFESAVDFDPGPGTYTLTSPGESIYIEKIDSGGNFVWVKTFGTATSGGQGFSIAADAYNNVYATGYFYGTIDFDPGPGAAEITSEGDIDAFVLGLSVSGNFVCAGKTGGARGDIGHDIAIDTARNKIYLCGHFNDPGDFPSNKDSADFDMSVNSAYYLNSAGGRDMFAGKYEPCTCITDTLYPVTNVSICYGNATMLSAGMLSAYGYHSSAYGWTPATALNGTSGSQVIANPTAAITYYAAGTNPLGCRAYQTIRVTVKPLPPVTDTSITLRYGEKTMISAPGGIAYEWTPAGGLSCTDCLSPVASPTATTVYTVKTFDANGCDATSVVEVKVLTKEIVIPNIFTPNGDHINDVLQFKITGYSSVSLRIYNRWGEAVFTTDDPDTMWNGYIQRTGDPAPEGVYYYVLEAKDTGDTAIKNQGYITLAR